MVLADEIALEILSNQYFLKLFKICTERSIFHQLKIDNKDSYSEKEFKDLLRFADLLSVTSISEARNYAYRIITYLNPYFQQNPYYCTVSKAVYYNLGNFPAVAYLEKENNNQSELPFDRLVELEAKKIIQEVPESEGIFFTDTQYKLFSELSSAREFSFSGPTSMGKSFIIKAFIRKAIQNKPPENLVVLVPTRALINQFALELKKDLGVLLEQYKYRIATNSNISEFSTEEIINYIMVLTPERLISYISQENPPIGFLFVDEAHKIAQNEDSRSITTYTSIEKTLKKHPNIKLYFSSPNVSNPEVFLKIFRNTQEKNHFKTNETPVAQNLYFADLENGEFSYFSNNELIKIKSPLSNNVKTINQALSHLGKRSNLVYCNTRSRTIEYAKSFADTINLEEGNKSLNKASRIIREYIHPDYYLAEIIKKGIAYHFGNMPQLIRNLVEDLYQKGEINFVFCTSTLLEGVNMPTQNLFILNNKKSTKTLKPIDFWNLAGRAGRLSKELQGNVFCVKHSDCSWDDTSFFNKKEIELVPSVFSRINHNLKKIETLLKGNEVKSGSEEEKNILKYIANIICIDTLEPKTGYCSPIIDELIKKNKNNIIELAKSKASKLETPYSILNSNESIGLDAQDIAYKRLKYLHAQRTSITLPKQVNYESCKNTLLSFHKLYNWKQTNKHLSDENSLKYYATLMNKWINDESLNQIISGSVDYYSGSGKTLKVSYNEYEAFNKSNKTHVNILIGNIINDIEHILRFQFEKYFNHYYLMLKNLLGEEKAGENWATLLEYGTQNRIMIALQNMGLSRHTTSKINKECKGALTVENGKLKNINKAILLAKFTPGTLEYDEVRNLL
ncbi:replicative superfamily II helicase [Dysgonomonas hofstadii]|uniref:Replicative superfamily II helicase n=1 Tax=Dysgonomonas hofstadii TaxID=637886 RepID=A0A840CZY0_9BACT|nr:DEAD/DEAH box helicase [Dysgonomonas hofstadii]MBB4038235.1 replicative superfamily II helicase [Dysgonomonas hofstadii]